MGLARRTALRLATKQENFSLEGLVFSIAAGDEHALARFHNATSGLVFGLLLKILGETATAEKVLTEVYLEVRQHARNFDNNHESILIWLATIAHRRALEHLCSTSEDRQFLRSVGLASLSGAGHSRRFSIGKSAHRRLVGGILNALSPAERKIVELTYFYQMTPQGIALHLRQSPEAIQTGLQYAVSQLYKLFNSQGRFSEA